MRATFRVKLRTISSGFEDKNDVAQDRSVRILVERAYSSNRQAKFRIRYFHFVSFIVMDRIRRELSRYHDKDRDQTGLLQYVCMSSQIVTWIRSCVIGLLSIRL